MTFLAHPRADRAIRGVRDRVGLAPARSSEHSNTSPCFFGLRSNARKCRPDERIFPPEPRKLMDSGIATAAKHPWWLDDRRYEHDPQPATPSDCTTLLGEVVS